MKPITYLLSLWITSIFFTGCSTATPEPVVAEKNKCVISPELEKLLKWQQLSLGKANQELALTGNVSYDLNNIYRYQSLANGVVQKTYFSLGDYVKKGQLLAEIKTVTLNEQRSEISKNEQELLLAERQLKATENLHKDGIASDKELLEAGKDVRIAQAELQRLQQTIQLQGGDIKKGVMQVYAPMNGYVVEKKMTPGYQVTEGDDNLFILSDLKKVWVMVNVYAAQLSMVKEGSEVEINTTAYPDKHFTGKITRLSNIFDPEEKVMKAVVEIDNSNLELKPDMMVSVNVQKRSETEAVAIPASAVIFDDDTYNVVRYHSGCDAENISFTPIAQDRNFYYTLEPVLRVGDTVISQNHLLVYNKLRGR